MYYLQSRYYDPEIRRFISADSDEYWGINKDFSGFAIFTYCNNNPVMNIDEAGHFWGEIWEEFLYLTQQSSSYYATAGSIA